MDLPEPHQDEPPPLPDRSAWTWQTYLRYYTLRVQGVWEIYAQPSRHFAYSILFVLPLLAAYGVGLSQGFRANFGHGMLNFIPRRLEPLLGTVVVNLLVAAGLIAGAVFLVRRFRENPVRLSGYSLLILLGMLVETAVLGLVLEAVREIIGLSWPRLFTFRPNPAVLEQIHVLGMRSPWQMIHASIGAGVFEELVYRVIMIRLLYAAAEGTDQPLGTEQSALNRAVLISSIAFAFMHIHYFSLGDIRGLVLGMISYVIMGILFAIVYLRRGYGIAAGSHAFVDIYLFFGVI